jgi:hypothetical protein
MNSEDRRQKTEDGQTKKRMKANILVAVAIIAIASFAAPAVSFACNYTFDVNLVSIGTDAARSAQNTLGFDNWYVWTYEVKVVPGEVGHAMSNWVLQLPNCYITSPNLFKEIEASASEKGTIDKNRIYDVEGFDITDHHPDPDSHYYGLKWDQVSGDDLDRIGEYEYFSFSVPTNQSIDTDWAVKAGCTEVKDGVKGPACPNCHDPGVPEPLSLLLFGSGLFGAGLFGKRKKTK